MVNSFLEYYQFNTKIAPDHIVLQRMEKKSGESFYEYAQMWRELAAQVQPPMMENEMVKWFIDNFKHLIEPLIREGSQAHLVPLGGKAGSILCYPCS